MPRTRKPTKLTDGQFYILAWLDSADRRGVAAGMTGVGIARTNSVPPCVTLSDNRTVYEPLGVSMAAVIGLARRGLAVASGYRDSFYAITDAGRAALAERSDLVAALGHPPDQYGMPVRVR